MIGIVVVSHSPALARAAVDLALQMAGANPPRIEVAAGAGDDVLGTDAVRVSQALTATAGPDGVLVFTDLGSAVLSAQLAVELSGVEQVLLTDAPFVEGLTAAVVSAAQGRSLAEVAREARGALRAKTTQLAPDEGAAPDGETAATEGAAAGPVPPGARRLAVTLSNPSGLHARPAALLVGALTGLDARIWAQKEPGGEPIEVTGTTALLILGARQGDRIAFRAAGDDGPEALSRIDGLIRDGFGETGAAAPDADARRTAQRAAQEADAAGTATGAGRPAPDPGAEPGPRASHTAAGPGAGTPVEVTPVGVSPGRAIAPVVQAGISASAPPRRSVAAEQQEAESGRLQAAFEAAAAFYRDQAARQSGQAAQILGASATMAEDRGLIAAAAERIRTQGIDAAGALWDVFEDTAGRLGAAGGLIAERAADVRDVRDRVLAALTGRPVHTPRQDRPERYILVAPDLAPADTAGLDPRRCVGIVTAGGGPTSHTAILARSLGIPAVVGAPQALGFPAGAEVFIDGETGRVVLDPDAELRHSVATQAPPSFTGDGRTADGRRVALLANIGGAADADLAVRSGAEGVGLFRTEFLFLDRRQAPTFDEQVTAYRAVFAAFGGKKVVVRTLDAGADKPLPFLHAAAEDNPALGVRGFRTATQRPEILEAQLAAIAAAADREHAEVQVMAPMIGTVEEARRFTAAVRRAGLPSAGVMVETPAAALTAADLFAVVDFVSLGTNDLTQYTMAADRLSGALAGFNDPWQPAVLRLAAMVGAAGRRAGKPVGVCGEAAADPLLAAVLVGSGVTSLSMTPRALGRVAERLASVPSDRCADAARAAAGADGPAAARAAAHAVLAG